MRPNASENEQISPTTTVPVARGVDSRPHLASVLQEGRKSTNINAGSGVIWGIPVKLPLTPYVRDAFWGGDERTPICGVSEPSASRWWMTARRLRIDGVIEKAMSSMPSG